MNTIVPTSCIAVAGQDFRQWRKLYRNKIKMFGLSWTEHVYMFIPVRDRNVGDPYEVRIYKNAQGLVIWAVGGEYDNANINRTAVPNAASWTINDWQKTTWVGWKEAWKRSYSDIKFLISFEKTRSNFMSKITKNRETYLLFPSKEVETATWDAINKAESGRGRIGIGAYSGPASLTIEELKALGCKVCHRPPTKKFPQVAPSDYVKNGFNWGAETPKRAEWFRYGSGYSYHGTVGCNSGWVWYD